MNKNNVIVRYGNRSKKHTFTFKDTEYLIRAVSSVLGKASATVLFKNVENNRFQIYDFFIMEFHYCIKEIIENRPELSIGLDAIGMLEIKRYLEEDTWLADRDNNNSFKLNYNNIRQKLKYDVLPNQKDAFVKYEEVKKVGGLRGYVLDAAPGTGKALKHGTKVLTKDNFIYIEDIKVGDTILNRKGEPTTVLAVYPQGVRSIYKVTFEDGRKCEVDGDHLWTIDLDNDITKTTNEIMELMKEEEISIPLYSPMEVNKTDKEYLISPYLMGVLLLSDDVTNIIKNMSNNYFLNVNNYMVNNNIDIYDKSTLKIPDEYMKTDDLNIIKQLLNGLTCCGKFDIIENLNETLLNQVTMLVNKLGKKCFRVKNDDKIDLDISNVYTDVNILKIKNIEYDSESLATCIAVDDDESLFLIEDYIVTHNTFMSLALKEALEYDTVIILALTETIRTVWVDSVINSLYKIPQSYRIMGDKNCKELMPKVVIMHYEYMDKLLRNKKDLKTLRDMKAMLIVDEYHNFNEIKSNRTRNLIDFVNTMDFKDIVMMSGTPVKMKMKEFIPLLKILDDKFKDIEDDFLKFYGNSKKYDYNFMRERFNLYRKRIDKDQDGRKGLDIINYEVNIPNGDRYLMSEISKRMLEYRDRRLKEVLKQENLSKAIYNGLMKKLEMKLLSNKYSKSNIKQILNKHMDYIKIIRNKSDRNRIFEIYDLIYECREYEKANIIANLDGEDKKEFRDIVSMLKYPKLKVMGEALGRVLLKSRIECYTEIAKNMDYKKLLNMTKKKTIVFSNYVEPLEVVYNKSNAYGYESVRVYDEHTKHLTDSVNRFNNLKDKTNPIIATYKSLSTGVPLVAGNVILCLDVPTRSYMFSQAISRADRKGQDSKVTVVMLKMKSDELNITNRDAFILDNSKRNVEFLTGNVEDYKLPDNGYETDESELGKDIVESELVKTFESYMDKYSLTNGLIGLKLFFK